MFFYYFRIFSRQGLQNYLKIVHDEKIKIYKVYKYNVSYLQLVVERAQRSRLFRGVTRFLIKRYRLKRDWTININNIICIR